MESHQESQRKRDQVVFQLLPELRLHASLDSFDDRFAFVANVYNVFSFDSTLLPGTETYESVKGYVAECRAEL